MNKVTLEKLLKARVDAINKAEETLTKLDEFCDKNWGFKFHDAGLLGDSGDHIVEWLNYGNSSPDVDGFIKFMDKSAKIQNKELVK